MVINVSVQYSGPSFGCPSIYAGGPDSHIHVFLSFFPFFFFGDVAFSEYFFVPLPFLLYGAYVVRSFLPDGVFYLVTTG